MPSAPRWFGRVVAIVAIDRLLEKNWPWYASHTDQEKQISGMGVESGNGRRSGASGPAVASLLQNRAARSRGWHSLWWKQTPARVVFSAAGFSSGWVVGENTPWPRPATLRKGDDQRKSRLVSVGLCKWAFVPEYVRAIAAWDCVNRSMSGGLYNDLA